MKKMEKNQKIASPSFGGMVIRPHRSVLSGMQTAAENDNSSGHHSRISSEVAVKNQQSYSYCTIILAILEKVVYIKLFISASHLTFGCALHPHIRPITRLKL